MSKRNLGLTIFLLFICNGIFASSTSEFRKIADSPEIYECEYFLTEAECDAVIAKAKPTLKRSTVVNDHSSEGSIDDRRTSLGTFLSQYSEIPAVQKIRRCAEKITGIPKKNGEGIQVLYYVEGAEYQPHFDYFDTNTVGGNIHYKRGGQRVATLLVYLNTPERGGETVFPKARISIRPIKGKAVLFYNVDLQGHPNPQSFHGGSPVLAGEKWIATLWIREDEFR